MQQPFCLVRHTIFFIVAHLPYRLTINAILYLAIFSAFMHLACYYLEQNPKKVADFINRNFQINISFEQFETHYNVWKPSFKLHQVSLRLPESSRYNLSPNNPNFKINADEELKIKSLEVSFELLRSLIFFKPYVDNLTFDGIDVKISKQQQNLTIGALFITQQAIQQKDKVGELIIPILQALPEWILKIKQFNIINASIQYQKKSSPLSSEILNHFSLYIKNTEWNHRLAIKVLPVLNGATSGALELKTSLNGSVYERNNWNGKFYIELSDLNYQQIKRHFPAKIQQRIQEKPIIPLNGLFNLNLWGDLTSDHIHRVAGNLALKDVDISSSKDELIYHLSSLKTMFSVQKERSFLQRNPQQKIASIMNIQLFEIHLNAQEHSLHLPQVAVQKITEAKSAQMLWLIPSLQLADLQNFVSPYLQSKENSLPKISGKLKNTQISFKINENKDNFAENLKFYSKINKLTTVKNSQFPGVKNISAQLWYEPQKGATIAVDAENTEIDLTPLFRTPLKFDYIVAQLNWQKIFQQYLLKSSSLVMHNKHITMDGSLSLWFNEKQFNNPLMMFSANLFNGNPQFVPLYLPTQIMDDDLVKWLDFAFIDGNVPEGRIIYRGRVQDFPYQAHPTGTMGIGFDVIDAQLNYFENWPHINNINAALQFTETGMKIDIEKARLFNSNSTQASIRLNNYLYDEVVVKAKINTNFNDALKYSKKTKLLSSNLLKRFEQSTKLDDSFDVDLKLNIPTDDRPLASQLKLFINKTQYHPNWLNQEAIKDINGLIQIDNERISQFKLKGLLEQRPIRLKLSKSNAQELKLQYFVSIAPSLLRKTKFTHLEFHPLLDFVSGQTELQGMLSIPSQQTENWQLDIISNLKGLKSKLPAPLNKSHQQLRDLKITLKHQQDHHLFSIALDNQLGFCRKIFDKASTNTLSFSRLQLGKNGIKNQCEKLNNSLQIRGDLDLEKFSQWGDFIEKQALFSPGKSAQLIRLGLDLNSLSFAKKEFSSSDQKNSSSNTNSHRIIVNGNIDKINYQGNTIAGAKIKSAYQKSTDSIFYQLKFNGNLNGKLDLSSNYQSNTSLLKPKLKLLDSGKFLKQLDIYHELQGTKSNIRGELNWRGDIYQFSLANLGGKLKLNTNNGVFTDINPGAGRLLGFLNLNDLSKKFSSNNSNQGYNFYSIDGDFIFNQGKMEIPELTLKSSIAKISLSGSSDLLAKTHQQTLKIFPDISSSLTYAGLLFAGPAGAAVGWIGQKVLGNQMNKINQETYDITGSWDEPKITLRNSNSPLNTPLMPSKPVKNPSNPR